ncbi:MAG: hypothetical protein MI924_13980, partial [Chloroflexales bacterium]|nr:hypothetical protein [Chloroflexales bacterium]
MHTFLLFVAGTTGFEPALSALTGLHVNHYTTAPAFAPSFVSLRSTSEGTPHANIYLACPPKLQ